VTAKRVLRTVAFSTAILLVLLPFQTAILSSENNPSNTSVVPAKRGSSAPLISIRGGTLNLNEPEETATATLRLSFSFEENDIVVIVEHDSDGTRATAVFHASFDSTEYCAHILSYHTFGRIACSGGAESTYSNTYIGEFRDASVSLNYFGERFYDPGIGRFVSMDTVLGAPQMPQSLNRYAYAINNPLKNADPSGEFFLSWIGAIVGGIIGAVAYTVTTLVTGQDWDWSAFGRSVAVGVIAGALTATCGICGAGLWANVLGGAAIGAGIGALGYAADRGIEYMQTGTLEWDWGQFGLSVGIGALAGAAGGYLRFRSQHKVVTQTNQARSDILAEGGGGRGGPTPGRIGAAGVEAVEEHLERSGQSILRGGGRVRVDLPGGGKRIYDSLTGGFMRRSSNIFHEVKAGFVSMTDEIASQIAKDSLRVAAGNRVTWHFLAGSSDDVLGALLSAGARVVRYV